MKILLVNGSPRKNGNSGTLIEKLKIKFQNDEITELHINELSFKGCQGCLSCRKNNTFCVVKDDLADILPKIIENDFISIVTPNYYGYITGQLKLFMDRWYCLKDSKRVSKFKEGTKVFFVVVQGAPNRDHSKNIMDWSKKFFESFNLKYYGYTVPGCSFENTDMVEMKYPEINMSINMFLG